MEKFTNTDNLYIQTKLIYFREGMGYCTMMFITHSNPGDVAPHGVTDISREKISDTRRCHVTGIAVP